jgi:NADPH2:quinone reductase
MWMFAICVDAVDMSCRLGEKSARMMRPSLFSTLQAAPGLFKELTAELLELVAGGVVVPQVHRVYPLSAAAEAQADLTSRRTTGKVLLRPDALIS